MSMIYSLDAILNTVPSEEVIRKILIKGSEIGCQYIDENRSPWGSSFLNPEQALLHIMEMWKEESQKYAAPISSGVNIKFQEIGFGLKFTEKSGFLVPWLRLYRHGWCKESSYVDFEKYTRLLFLLVQDFTIIWLKTYDEGYDEELYVNDALSYPQLRKQPDLSILPQFRVETTIIPDYDYDTLHNLLEHGEKKGWRYYLNKQPVLQQNPLSVQQAATNLLEQSPKGACKAMINCVTNNIEYQLTFDLRANAYFRFTLAPLDKTSVELQETVLHVLDLCTDFCILELTTFDARYNYIRTSFDDVK